MQPNTRDPLWVCWNQQWDRCHFILLHLDLCWLSRAEFWWVWHSKNTHIHPGKVCWIENKNTKQIDAQEWWEPTRGKRKTHRTCWARQHKETVMRVKPIETWHPTNNFRSNQLHILRQQGSKAEWEGEGQALKPRMTVLLSNGRSAQTHSDIPSCSNTAPSFEAEAGCCLWNGIKGKHGHAAKQMHN